MKKIFTLLTWFVLVLNLTVLAQQATYFSSGDFTIPGNWTQGTASQMTEMPDGSSCWKMVSQLKANTGNATYRYYSAPNRGTIYEPSGSSNVVVPLYLPKSLEVSGSGKVWQLQDGNYNTSDNFIFKTSGSGTPGTTKQVLFRVQGAIADILSIGTNSPTIYVNETVTIEAHYSCCCRS